MPGQDATRSVDLTTLEDADRKSMPMMRQISKYTTSTQSQTTIPISSHILMHRPTQLSKGILSCSALFPRPFPGDTALGKSKNAVEAGHAITRVSLPSLIVAVSVWVTRLS